MKAIGSAQVIKGCWNWSNHPIKIAKEFLDFFLQIFTSNYEHKKSYISNLFANRFFRDYGCRSYYTGTKGNGFLGSEKVKI
jgi:hypothetical protein